MSAISSFNPDIIPPDQYTADKGLYIASEFASGESLKSICDNSEGWLPSMLIVRRWRSMFPAFDSLMIEAAACRAENHAEMILKAANNESIQAAQARNQMAAHEKLAGFLSPAVYGDKQNSESPNADSAPVYALTDEQLLAIASGRMQPSIEGECLRIGADGGVRPPSDQATGALYEVPDPQESAGYSGEHSVTTIDDIFGKAIREVYGRELDTEEPCEVGISFIGMED